LSLPKNDEMNIAVTIDRNYAQAAGVMLNSLFLNTTSKVHVYLLHPDLKDADIAQFNELVSSHAHAAISYHSITSQEMSGLPINGHLTSVMYYLFLLPEVLPHAVEKVLYLDPDMLVLSDIEEVWQTDLGESLLAAVPVFAEPREMIVSEGEDYFNSGVVLINLKRWREEGLQGKLMEMTNRLAEHVLCPDQDVLNVVTKNRWKKLTLSWNKRPDFYLNQGSSIYSNDEINTAEKDVGIIHFTGPVKPWHYACSHPKRGLYLKYKKDTPWASVPLDGKNIISFFARMLPLRIATRLSRVLAHSVAGKIIKKITLNP